MHSFVKQTPVTAACISDLLPEIVTTIGANSTPTFSIFLSTEDDVGFDPANNCVNVTFSQVGIIRGSTSVAFRSAPDEPVSENTLPTGAVVITGSAEENQTLGVNTSDLLDGDGLGSFLFQWQRNETNITNANEATYSLGDEDVDTNIRVVVSYTDDGGSFESVTSAAVLIANINNAPVIQDPLENLVAYVSQEFVFLPVFDDIDTNTSEGEVLSLRATQLPAWLSFFSLVQGRITGTPQITDIGEAPVSIIVQDDEGLSDTLSFIITVVAQQTVTLSWTAPTQRVNGEALGAEDLSLYKISYGLSDQTPTVTTIPATSTSYIIPGALAPGTYYFKVKAIDTDSLESVYSDEIAALIGSPSSQDEPEPEPENTLPTGAVVITGSAQEDQTLGVDTTALRDVDGLGSLLFQWQRNETNIASANDATYSLDDEDVDANFNVVVSYTDDGGSFESVTSASVLIANINDAPVIQDPSENLVAYVSEEFDFTPLFDDIDSTTSEGEELSLTVTQLPAWLSFFPLDQGRITGTPQITDVGQAPVSITVQDDGGLSDTLSFTITIVEPKTVTLSWTAPTQRVNGEALSAEELSLYKISYELSGQTPTVTTIPATSTSYIIPVALTPGTYYFKVKAIDADSSESDYTDEISAVID